MKTSEILEAHIWLRNLKAVKKLSNKVLGSHIQYSDTGMAKALRNNTLDLEQIEVIAKKYDLLEDLKTNLSNSKTSSGASEFIDFKEGIGVYLNNHHKRLLLEDSTYKLFIEKIAAYEAIKITKELLSNR